MNTRHRTIKDVSPGHIPIIRAVLDVVFTANFDSPRTMLNADSYVMLAMEARSRLNVLEDEFHSLQEKVERYERAKRHSRERRKP